MENLIFKECGLVFLFLSLSVLVSHDRYTWLKGYSLECHVAIKMHNLDLYLQRRTCFT